MFYRALYDGIGLVTRSEPDFFSHKQLRNLEGTEPYNLDE